MEVSTKHSEFDQWMQAVDGEVYRIAGVSVWDLPDCPFADWFGELSAKQAARKALLDAGMEE